MNTEVCGAVLLIVELVSSLVKEQKEDIVTPTRRPRVHHRADQISLFSKCLYTDSNTYVFN